MVLIFIVYSNAVDEEIVEMVKKYAEGYTKFTGLQGEGSGEPHLGSHIWPGVNNCIMVAADNKVAKHLKEGVEELAEKFPGVAVHIMATALKKI